MKIEQTDIADLSPDPDNARLHDKKNLDAIKASLEAFGQRKPIVTADGVVVAGNGTLEAAQALGWTTIATVSADDLIPEQRTAFAIADNRTAELAAWDDTKLAQALAHVTEDGDELGEATGFDHETLVGLIEKELGGEVVEDEGPGEVPAEPITKEGDLWLLGGHRVLCGDSTSADDVARLMAESKADLWLTDPPYNVDYTGGTKDALKIENDSMSDTDFRKFLVACSRSAFDAMKPGASFYVFHADSEGYNFRGAINDCGERVRQCLIWVKNSLVLGRQDYHWQHEPCLYGWKQGASHSWFSGRADTTVFDDSRPKDITKLKKEDLLTFAQSLVSQMELQQTTVLREAKPNASIDHPTMKPVRLIARLIKNSSEPKGLIYDPFLGSGTTLIAAEQLGRKCYGLEISPAYCDVIVNRWQKLTGEQAANEKTGDLFPVAEA